MRSYLNALEDVLINGSDCPQRALVDGKPVFARTLTGVQIRHDLRMGFPLLTTKKVSLSLVASELEFFIQGERDVEKLHQSGNHIWDEWRSPKKEFPGDLGRIYGVQWRQWMGVDLEDAHKNDYLDALEACISEESGDYAGAEAGIIAVDQFKNLLKTLETNPWDRRMVVTAWNPAELGFMALPPCHMIWQVVVTQGGLGQKVLNMCCTMRSADMMLGVPFNIASYALLCHLLAKHAGMTAGMLTMSLNNAHIYENHISAAREQIQRQPGILPEIKIASNGDSNDFSILKWKYTDLELIGYSPMPGIKLDVAV
jgi:thymidylate synthase